MARVSTYLNFPDTTEDPLKLNIGKLAVSLLVPFIAGGIGSFATMSEISGWYTTLAKDSAY